MDPDYDIFVKNELNSHDKALLSLYGTLEIDEGDELKYSIELNDGMYYEDFEDILDEMSVVESYDQLYEEDEEDDNESDDDDDDEEDESETNKLENINKSLTTLLGLKELRIKELEEKLEALHRIQPEVRTIEI